MTQPYNIITNFIFNSFDIPEKGGTEAVIKEEDDVAGLEDPAVDVDDQESTCASVALLKLWTGACRESAPRFLVEPVAPTTPPCTLKATTYTDITLPCNHPLFLEFCECV